MNRTISALVLSALATVSSPALAQVTLPPNALPPDLVTLDLKSFRIETTDTDAGGLVIMHRVLRFTNTVANVGLGPMQLLGVVENGQANAYQQIFLDDGTTFDVYAGTFIYHPTHTHWHFEDFSNYELWRADGAADTNWLDNSLDPANLVASHGKVTFCLADTVRLKQFGDPIQLKRPNYTVCGTEIQGISVGWGDAYIWDYFDQWIDLDQFGVGDGFYWVVSTADPDARLIEIDETNNVTAALVQIYAGGTRVRRLL